MSERAGMLQRDGMSTLHERAADLMKRLRAIDEPTVEGDTVTQRSNWDRECEYIDTLAAALRGADAWQPIETAPNDGTDVLIFPPMTVALKTPDTWTDGTGATLHPTHWMPLPPLPDGATPPRSRSG